MPPLLVMLLQLISKQDLLTELSRESIELDGFVPDVERLKYDRVPNAGVLL